MRVAVDARTVYSARRRGTGKNLIDLYRRVARLQPDWRFIMFHRRGPVPADPFADEPNVTPMPIDIMGDHWNLWEQVRLPIAARASGVSVLHCPANTAPAVPLVPLVVTIHDLIPLDMSPESGAAQAWAATVARGARRARRIITPSSYTKDAIAQRFGIPSTKIVVNHWAPDAACTRVEDAAAIDAARLRYGLATGQGYAFGFGASDPRKNTMRIIDAWAALGPTLRQQLGLLLVGLQEPFLTEARARAAALAPEGGWSLVPFAAEEDLPALMTGATLLCYPSLSEGFGLPVLDAFACGTPVVTSATTSLPEVAGDAAILVDPTDVGAIREAMTRIATSEALHAELRALGYARLRAFSWDRCARTAATVLREAA
jgi:glycosyltransferase involved in cell wall biosynthesis